SAPTLSQVRCGGDGVAPGTVVSDAMLLHPKVCAADLSVAAAHELFGDDHVHALLVVGAGVLLAVVEQADLAGAPAEAPARHHGRLGDRVVGPHEDMLATWTAMLADGRRRLAVVDGQGALLGLLCLKRSGRGFCSQADVDARARERGALAP
ncbi:MAG TPA: CBS domain-containing protein, partial [Actinomycetospora sp.]|nr:CBS domain-containing protein [Actinomycetospora sp.]